MSFYANISKYYEHIFPVKEPQKNFFNKHLQDLPEEKVLDIACGTGGHTLEFGKWGFNAVGIDLDETVIKKAKKNAEEEGLEVDFQTADMLNLPFTSAEFGGVVCIGNSLVHLLSETDIFKALKEMYRVLKPGGKLILQIVNYDRILDNNLRGLPTIENTEVNLRFERNYKFRFDGLIDFNTVLKVPEGQFTNTVELYPLRKTKLEELCKEVGFKILNIYGNFLGVEYTLDSFATIVVAEK